MSAKVDSLKLEMRRDGQQWILDWVVKQAGREQNLEFDDRNFPSEVKSHAMIPRALQEVAAHRESIARAAEERGHRATARDLYFAAIEPYHHAQHRIYEDDNPDKVSLCERISACFDRVMALADYRIERMEIPWEAVSVPAALHKVGNGTSSRCRRRGSSRSSCTCRASTTRTSSIAWPRGCT